MPTSPPISFFVMNEKKNRTFIGLHYAKEIYDIRGQEK